MAKMTQNITTEYNYIIQYLMSTKAIVHGLIRGLRKKKILIYFMIRQKSISAGAKPTNSSSYYSTTLPGVHLCSRNQTELDLNER